MNIIKRVKESVSIPVIASGDIVDRESLDRVKKYTNCDAFMIGRGALGSPEIFADLLDKHNPVSKIDTIKRHVKLLREYYPEQFISGHIRKHFLWYLKGYTGASAIKVQVSTEQSIDKVIDVIDSFINSSTNA